jgi:hypothetical protein
MNPVTLGALAVIAASLSLFGASCLVAWLETRKKP